ncbi:hypothetical protein [uncultured Maritimibacter sp.]|uniref:hypothetical protein n=1 Tax=uncultured Maritimibacter sp. TaxID=991866 RepID=UPI00260A4760|nr:hypothetical protein [uncultured Maritimibacter sp.]
MSKPAVQLAPERHLQLKRLAEALGGVNISEALGKLIELAMSEGLIEHEIPGIRINALHDGIAIAFENGATQGFSFEEAADLAASIRRTVGKEAAPLKEIDSQIEPNPKFAIKKTGHGLSISIPAASAPKSLDRSLGNEFARLIEKAIADQAG